MPTPTFSLDFAKVGIGILVVDFQENILMSSDSFQNLLNKILLQFKTSLTWTSHYTDWYFKHLFILGIGCY
jgi:hypothetical protein